MNHKRNCDIFHEISNLIWFLKTEKKNKNDARLIICLLFFQQNETAMDVAKRKEHSEIITIIQTFTRVSNPY